MVIPCPSCQGPVEVRSPPIRGHAGDGSEAWVCLCCPAIICVDCYHEHTRKKHPEEAGERKKRSKK